MYEPKISPAHTFDPRHINSTMPSAAFVAAVAAITISIVVCSTAALADTTSSSASWTPPTYNSTVIAAFAGKTLLNPFAMPNLSWNPYSVPGFNTTWPRTVCAVVYPDPSNRSAYYLRNFESAEAARAHPGAHVTHLHPCGLCSTTKDLAVYMRFPDLTNPGRRCGLIGIFSPKLGLECFAKIGFTMPCAYIWMRDAQNTRKFCFDICMKDLIEHVPNNVPPNSTNLNPCLECDEVKSGPVFKKVAGRTRRDSGIKSAINRPAASVYQITHYYY